MKSAVEGSDAVKAAGERNIRNCGVMLLKKQLTGMAAAQSIHIFGQAAAEVLIKNMGETAFAITEVTGYGIQCGRSQIILLRMAQNILAE